MNEYQPNWLPISTAPKREVWVYQPAVVYKNGKKFSSYITKASPTRGGCWYSEEYNVLLEPTHWAEFMILPPDNKIVESPRYSPYDFVDVSSSG